MRNESPNHECPVSMVSVTEPAAMLAALRALAAAAGSGKALYQDIASLVRHGLGWKVGAFCVATPHERMARVLAFSDEASRHAPYHYLLVNQPCAGFYDELTPVREPVFRSSPGSPHPLLLDGAAGPWAYWAVPVRTPRGLVAGHLLALSDRAETPCDGGLELLGLAAERLGAEWQRSHDEAALRGRASQAERDLHSAIAAGQAGNGSREDEVRYRSFFDAVPVSVRVEDFSRVREKVDELGIEDEAEFADYLDRTPAFVEHCATLIDVIDVNHASLATHGFDDKAAFIAHITQSFSSTNLEAIAQGLKSIHRRDTALEFETTIVSTAGETRNLMVRWLVPPGDENVYARTLLTSIDITDLRRAEQRLRRAEKMEAMGQLTGGVAHDFNNLLAVIQGNAELLVMQAGQDSQGRLGGRDGGGAKIQAILHAVERGAELTGRLLSFSREQPLRPVPINVVHQLRESRPFFGPAFGEQVGVRLAVPADLWRVRADPGAFDTALLNLLLNARDAMPDGGTVHIGAENVVLESGAIGLHVPDLEPGDYVRLSIRDEGIGLDASSLERVFEPFYTTKEIGQGSGLGLSMVYGFARQSGGGVSISSTPGEGATVYLFLPRDRTAVASHEYEDETSVYAEPEGGRYRGRVLLVEDDMPVSEMVTEMLERLGFDVSPHRSADTALHALETHGPLVMVVTDIALPGEASGYDLATEARERLALPVITMSGYADDLIHAPALGAQKHLHKPFSFEALAFAVEQLLPE